MKHLIEEHSSECLLSFVEMIQYKESILTDMKAIQPPHLANISNVSGIDMGFPITPTATSTNKAKNTTAPFNKKNTSHLSIPSTQKVLRDDGTSESVEELELKDDEEDEEEGVGDDKEIDDDEAEKERKRFAVYLFYMK